MADFYQILGVSEMLMRILKRAYRKLARQYHPDVNKEPGAEDKFKEIGKAYEALADPETRLDMISLEKLALEVRLECLIWAIWVVLLICLKPSLMALVDKIHREEELKEEVLQGDDLRYDLNVDFKDAIFGQRREIKIPHLETCEVCGEQEQNQELVQKPAQHVEEVDK